MERKIVRNALRCGACLDVIESRSRWDFNTCSCGRWSILGGHDYLEREWDEANFVECEDLSEWYPPISENSGVELGPGRI